MTLHLIFLPSATVRDRLDRWDEAVRREIELTPGSWRLLTIWPAARDATISGSTGIEGNPLDVRQVEAVLAGAAVDADADHIREVANYNRALIVAREAAHRPDFAWTPEIIHQVNAAVMDGLPRDTRGAYRRPGEEVFVGIYAGPGSNLVQSLMDELVDWLRRTAEPPLVQSALLHLNLIAIHPFNDGNGRTSRILSSMALVRSGVRAPELISIEAYLRRNRDEYLEALRTTLGTSYDPNDHPVGEWLDYYTRISLDRLEARNRILDALPADLGVVHAALADAGEHLDWAATLLAARVSRLRTPLLAELTGRSQPAARAELGRLVRAGWLEPRGRTRGRWYAPSARLEALALRVPLLMRRLASGDQLTLFDPDA